MLQSHKFMIVAKFGGTSVNTSKRVLTLCNIICGELKRHPVVVVSALRGVTDLLLSLPALSQAKVKEELKRLENIHSNLVEELFKDMSLREKINQYTIGKVEEITDLLKKKSFSKAFLDELVSFGEIISSYIIAQALKNCGIKATQVVATDLIITNDNFGSAEFLVEPTKRNIRRVLTPLVKKGIVPVVTGFIGSTQKGEVTTLGRGGSDYTASIIGFCLEASEIQIWTDVDGIFTADPKLVKKAKLLPVVSFREASELATFGARVLHPRTIRPAISAGIPVRVLNTSNPQNAGTLIKEQTEMRGIVKAVSFKQRVILVNIYSTEMLLQKGFLEWVFRIFANNNISIDLVSVSEVSISVTLDNGENLEEAVAEISEFANVSVIEDLGMISLIGEGVTSETKTIKRIFEILDKEKILAEMVSLGATNINISIVVQSDKVEQAVKAFHSNLLK